MLRMEQCRHSMALKLTLHSPAGSEPNVYEWPFTPGQERVTNHVAVELVETIRWVCVDFPEMAIDNSILSNYDTKSYQSMSDLVCEYNRAIDTTHKRQKIAVRPAERLKHRASRGLLRHILQQVYNQSVADPEKLNQYVPFSTEVYGETSYDLICQLIDNIKMSEEDIFIDLGSGVGQIVLQVAASTSCKMVWGIEISEWPSRFAKNMDFHFRRLMRWWGKLYGEFQLIKGDFLDQRHSEKIYSATVVFVNNFAFDPNLDHQLKERFADLRDGIRIVSSKAFCPQNFKISDRNLSDIGTIIHASELPFLRGSVSWTGKPLEHYYNQFNDQLPNKSKIKEEENAQLKQIGRHQKLFNQVFQNDRTVQNSGINSLPSPLSHVVDGTPMTECSVNFSGKMTTRKSFQHCGENQIQKEKAGAGCKSLGRVGKREADRRSKLKEMVDVSIACTELRNVSASLSRKLSWAQGCIHQQLPPNNSPSSIPLEKIPLTPSYGNIPLTLQEYLVNVRNQMMSVMAQFKDHEHQVAIMWEIEFERDRRIRLSSQAALLDKQILHLAETGKKLRLQQEVVYRNRNLTRFNGDVTGISTINQESILKEIAVVLHRREKLNRQVSKLISQASDVGEVIYNGQPSSSSKSAQKLLYAPTPARNLHQISSRPHLSLTEKGYKENHSELPAKKMLHPNRTLAENKMLALPKAGSKTRFVLESRLQKLITSVLNDKANRANCF